MNARAEDAHLVREMADQVAAFVVSDGYFSVLPAWEFLARDEDRYGDLAGPDIDQVMRQLGWRYTCRPLCVMAMTEDGDALAMGWAARTNFGGEDGGVNLSYAVAPQAQGQGLAVLCTSLALLELDRREQVSPQALVHAQFDITNMRSAGVAARLGLHGDRALCLNCTIRTPRLADRIRSFMGASAPWGEVRERAGEFAEGRQVIAWGQYAPPPAPRMLRERG